MRTQVNIWIFVCLFILQACYEDKGNYSYSIPNKVTISYPQGNTDKNVIMGEPYIVIPKLEFSIPADSAKIESWWVFESDTVGHERNLTYTFDRAATGASLYHYVKDLTTGYISVGKMIIDVKSKYSKGWCILSEHGNNSVLGFVLPKKATPSTVKKFESYPNVYRIIHADDELGTQPVMLAQAFASSGSMLTVLQKGGEGSVVLNGDDYSKEIYTKLEFVGEKYPVGFIPKAMANKQTYDILLSENGKVYSRVSMDNEMKYTFFTTSFIDLPLTYKDEMLNVDRVVPMHYGNSKMIVVYEAVKKRFLCINVVSYSRSGDIVETKMADCPANASPAEKEMYDNFSDLNNLGDYDLLYVGAYNVGYQASYLMMVLKKGAEFKVQSCKLNMYYNLNPAVVSDMKIYSFNTSLISERTKFFMIDKRPYLFFAEAGMLYWFDLLTGKERLFYDFGGKNVADMEVNPARSELAVGLENGEFYVFNINDDVLFNTQIRYQTSGFDRIIDVIYKLNNLDAWYDSSED